ncbi:hypothetical protein [Enterovirga sp.]|uniref:hypothetical protein n=1 Tax=Enterovirga sp. TaxID=2026350 RepID=UPI002B8FB121|nr:hypothetical protein [Enterovirga sp.]HMO31216.1 hypothetical protein [Enterovirga sp.]
MSAMSKARPSPDYGTAAPLEFVHEFMWSICMLTEIGMRYAAIGDAIGLAYVSRKMAAYMRAAIPIVKELEQARRAES